MRTIKFRAWDKVNNRFIWLFSESVLKNIFSQSHSDQPQDVRQGRLFNRSDSEYELSQFTGLHDKNGKEIYEGDVCKWSSWFLGSYQEINGDKIISLVEWSNKKGKWFVKNDIWDLGIYSDIEVIGNIYENPELVNN